MAKTAPTVSNTPATASADASSSFFRDVAHKGHTLTHVGSFSDGVNANPVYDVWYCRNDHAIFIG